jgi:NAD(P)-dependent dehydrogenase (short-subunit alcohol dehydrogenase family)
MSNNIGGKVVVITGANGGLGEASARPVFQDYLKFRPLCRLSCLALDDLQPAGNRR